MIIGFIILGVLQVVLYRMSRIDLDRIERKIMDIDQVLQKIDAATTKTAANLQIIADTDQKISDEIDAFLAAAPAGTVLTDAQATQLQSLADRLQANSDATDAQVPVLQAIAAKGAGNPVPVPPPAPPATP
jgi:ABC-type transporter Mla subunit MlaD